MYQTGVYFLLFFLFVTFSNAQNDVIVKCLQESYPTVKIESGKHSVKLDGRKFIFDDGVNKNFQALLNQPDIEDMFHYRYISGKTSIPENDPGRIRHEGFFRAVYGENPEAVETNLITVPWMPKSGGRSIWVTQLNGVAEKVRAISAELDRLPEELKKYVLRPSGGYKWRKILDTERISVHSFGIAIDIDASLGHYWKWDLKKNGKIAYRNQIPQEIVDIFERHGFIWGGKWHHYDTMHFEYRPELFCNSRSLSH